MWAFCVRSIETRGPEHGIAVLIIYGIIAKLNHAGRDGGDFPDLYSLGIVRCGGRRYWRPCLALWLHQCELDPSFSPWRWWETAFAPGIFRLPEENKDFIIWIGEHRCRYPAFTS